MNDKEAFELALGLRNSNEKSVAQLAEAYLELAQYVKNIESDDSYLADETNYHFGDEGDY